MKWISQNNALASGRHTIARTRSKWTMWALDDGSEDSETRREQFKTDDQLYWKQQKQKNMPKIKYEPARGNLFTFLHKGQPIVLRREAKPGNSIITEESELVWLHSRTRSNLESLIKEVRDLQTSKAHWVKYYRGATMKDTSGWHLLAEEPPRCPSTLVLDKGLQDKIESDVKDYLDPSTKDFYRRIGKPYRRGFLLHGPPGTGKSSLCAILAGMFCMDFYTLSLNDPKLTEDSLAKMFRELPDHVMVVLEDIDRALHPIGRPKADTPPGTEPQACASGVSFSAVLNVVDGPGAKENRVLFMTTNHREKLDPALIRPGRIDETFYLGYATATMVRGLFALFYEHIDAAESEISRLASKFASEIPNETFTAADIQNFLLRYKGAPETAVSNVGDWVSRKGLCGDKTVSSGSSEVCL